MRDLGRGSQAMVMLRMSSAEVCCANFGHRCLPGTPSVAARTLTQGLFSFALVRKTASFSVQVAQQLGSQNPCAGWPIAAGPWLAPGSRPFCGCARRMTVDRGLLSCLQRQGGKRFARQPRPVRARLAHSVSASLQCDHQPAGCLLRRGLLKTTHASSLLVLAVQ